MKKFKIDQFVVYKGQLMKVFNRNRFFNVYTLETFDGHLIFSIPADQLKNGGSKMKTVTRILFDLTFEVNGVRARKVVETLPPAREKKALRALRREFPNAKNIVINEERRSTILI